MRLPGPIENHPDYLLLSEYFDEEQVERIIESGIPINRVGVVPSLMVPPGQGCEDIATEGLAGIGLGAMIDAMPTGLTRNFVTGQLGNTDWMADVPLSTIGTQRTQEIGWWQTLPDLFTSKQPAVATAIAPSTAPQTPKPDAALEWVESNWLMIAAGLGALLVLGVATKKR